jgi:hypothetical protein
MVPPQVPGAAVSVCPVWVGPEILGADRLIGVPTTTMPVCAVSALLPAEFVALSTIWSRLPTSADTAVYVRAVAAAMLTQVMPVAASHRCHWWLYLMGAVPYHVPCVAVRILPSGGLATSDAGVIVGGAVLQGMVAVGEHGPAAPAAAGKLAIASTPASGVNQTT